MDKLRNYDISFSGITNGKHDYIFEIDEAFFQLFTAEKEFTNPRIQAEIILEKHTAFLEFKISTKGQITLSCDISGKEFDHYIENEISVLVKFGDDYDDSQDDVITIPANEHSFNVAHLIFEDIMLSVPMKKISPEISEEDLALLQKYETKTENQSKITEVDPRWEILKKLKDN